MCYRRTKAGQILECRVRQTTATTHTLATQLIGRTAAAMYTATPLSIGIRFGVALIKLWLQSTAQMTSGGLLAVTARSGQHLERRVHYWQRLSLTNRLTIQIWRTINDCFTADSLPKQLTQFCLTFRVVKQSAIESEFFVEQYWDRFWQRNTLFGCESRYESLSHIK